ncbi:MAG: hypothetical protein PVH03_14405 [Chloroflexota bacterium]
MKKRLVVVFVLVFVTTLLLVSTYQVSAKGVRTAVSSYEYDCFTGFTDSGGVWEDDEVMHMRGVLHTNPNVSDTPELTGLHHTVANAEINKITGYAVIRGTSNWEPEGIDGAWKGYWIFIYNENMNSGKAVLRGTGALKGKMLFLDVYDAEPDGKLEEKCAGIGDPEGYVLTEGYMLDTRRQ